VTVESERPHAAEPRVCVVVVGEALVDQVERPGEPVVEHPGGSPANVALTLGRLGHDVHLLTRLGDDERGQDVTRHLDASGVRLLAGSLVTGRTSTALARIGADGAAQYEFDLHWELPDPVPPLPAHALCLHTGSVAALLEPGAAQVVSISQDAGAGATISYDPNIRPVLLGPAAQVRPQVEALVALADVVKLSDEDACWLSPADDPEQLAAGWLVPGSQPRGPAVVVLTRGSAGAVAFCSNGRVEVAPLPVTVSDTVGAGDSFSGALIDALATHGLLGADRRAALRAIDLPTLQDVVTHAVRVAAVTVSRPGADPPTRAELAAQRSQP